MRTEIYCIGLMVMIGCHQKRKDYKGEKIITVKAQLTDTIVSESFSYNTYCNARFSYCVDYPEDLLTPQQESENGDGRIFTDGKGKEILRVYGTNMLSAEGDENQFKERYYKDLLDENEANLNDKLEVTYTKLGSDFYVISGFKKGYIYYQKMIERKDNFACMVLQYSAADSNVYNIVATKIAATFH